MKEKIKKIFNKKLLIILGIIILLAILIFFGLKLFSTKSENHLKKSLEDMGSDFYTNLYYKQFSESYSNDELLEFLKKYETVGFKISLENLSRYNSEENKSKVENFDKEKCDKEKTLATIYPKEPYGKTDFTIEATLICGADTATTTTTNETGKEETTK